MRIDRIMLESELSRVLPELLSLMYDGKRRSLERDILMARPAQRLPGLLPGHRHLAHAAARPHLRPGRQVGQGLRRSRRRGHRGVCVSILPERFSRFEDRSLRRDTPAHPRVPARSLHHVYFDLDETLVELRRRLDTVVARSSASHDQQAVRVPDRVHGVVRDRTGRGTVADDIPIKVIGSGVVGLRRRSS